MYFVFVSVIDFVRREIIVAEFETCEKFSSCDIQNVPISGRQIDSKPISLFSPGKSIVEKFMLKYPVLPIIRLQTATEI